MQSNTITESTIDSLRPLVHLKNAFSHTEDKLIEMGRIAGGTVKFSFDSKIVVSSGYDTSLHIFDTSTYERLYSSYATGPTWSSDRPSISFHPSEHVLITNYDRSNRGVMLLNYVEETSQLFTNATIGQDWSEAFNKDGTLWAQTHYGNHARVSIYDLKTATKQYDLAGHTGIVSGVLFSPDNKMLATAGGYISSGRIDETVRLWDVSTGMKKHILTASAEHMPMKMAFSPDSSTLAVSYFIDTVGEIYIFDTSSGEVKHILRGHSRPVNYLKFTSDGTRLATASWDNTIRLWNIENAQEVFQFKHEDFFQELFFTIDNSLLIAVARFGVLIFLNSQTGQPVGTHSIDEEVSSLALSPDGTLLAIGEWEGVQLWGV